VAARLSLLLSTPRIAPGLLSREAWAALERAGEVLGRDADEPQLLAIEDAGVPATALGDVHPAELARLLVDHATEADVVWVGSSDGDPGLTDALAAEVSRRDVPPEVELLVGSYDVPGSRLLDLVAVMDRLRSPGGCPWDAQQTHESLVPYLIEESHEAVEAIESGDRAHMTEELGDLLLQVVFHARVAQEDPQAPFGIDDVAAGIVEKLVRRHPHVFAGVDADTAAEVAVNWEHIKAAEKAGRTGVLDGIPAGLPALARADKAASRLERSGLSALASEAADGQGLGARLMALVLEARTHGEDPEAALRAVVRSLEQAAADAGR
jgi:XTP/dITP diphosphohydrolase